MAERIQTLTCLKDIKGKDSTQISERNKVRPHFFPQFSSEKFCLFCPRQIHHLRVCPEFRKHTSADRYSLAKRHRHCINCLSRGHDVRNCTSSHSCSKCHKRHHTLLHHDTTSNNSSTTPSQTSPQPICIPRSPQQSTSHLNTPSTSSGQTSNALSRQVFHTSQNKSVLLGTAMVNIIHHGVTYTARALIDPASEASFVSESLQQRRGIDTISSQATISGVNQGVSILS